MRRELQVSEMYAYVIREYGTPNKMVIKNTKVFTCKRWNSFKRRFCNKIVLDIYSSMLPRCHKNDDEFKFFNSVDDEILVKKYS